ncbi:MAG: hypothetical protein IH951_09920 [Bacteroidetes bacterium]|nr:hypothetical protein [Bacteroidota bacterium]
MDFFLPEWAPNIHPLLVHFPIALLFVAVALDGTGLLLRRRPFFRQAAVLLYVLGGIAVFVTFLAGKQAADLVFLSTEGNAVLTEHADLALWTVWFFGVFAILRPVIDFTPIGKKTAVWVAMVVIPAAGLILLYQTAEHGAQLVFRYGAGVKTVDNTVQGVPAAPGDLSAETVSAPVLTENGGWSWKPTHSSAWKSSMTFPAGAGDFSQTSIMDGGERGEVLALSTDGHVAMFVFDQPVNDIQVDFAANVDQFDGVLMFVHHVEDARNYHFTSIGNGEMRQGRSENGDIHLLDAKPYHPSGWVTFRVVSDGAHARAYGDEVLVAHGHGPTPDAGPSGFRLNGTGTVLLDFVRVQVLR